MFRQIASGTDTTVLGNFDNLFREHDRGYLELELRWVPPGLEWTLDNLADVLRRAGVNLYRDAEVVGNTVRIHFQQGIPALVVIAAALVGLWLVLVVSWRLFKEEAIAASLFIFILVAMVLGAAVLIATKGKVAAPGIAVGG